MSESLSKAKYAALIANSSLGTPSATSLRERAKLSREAVWDIRRVLAELAARHSISYPTILAIVQRFGEHGPRGDPLMSESLSKEQRGHVVAKKMMGYYSQARYEATCVELEARVARYEAALEPLRYYIESSSYEDDRWTRLLEALSPSETSE